MDRSDSRLEICCHLGIATEHAIYACSFATALCRLCYRASYKMREACEQIFPSSACSAKQTRARLRSYPTKYYLFGVHAQVSYLSFCPQAFAGSGFPKHCFFPWKRDNTRYTSKTGVSSSPYRMCDIYIAPVSRDSVLSARVRGCRFACCTVS